jgi:DNA modification methylase
MTQLRLPIAIVTEAPPPIRLVLESLLASDLGFHRHGSNHASHSMHAFPAKFPPQLPRVFIERLTRPGDLVLDPMMGSGTTLVEALLAGRSAVGLDIDPLALRLAAAKTTALDIVAVSQAGNNVVRTAQHALAHAGAGLAAELARRFDPATRAFLDYWFSPRTQMELVALIRAIELVADHRIRAFLELAFSAIIITKSGGVSLARDLAHTRPHRVRDKTYRSALLEFRKRLEKNIGCLADIPPAAHPVTPLSASAECMPLAADSVDLLITSPPYASNAIDYMRAHKFSLVWLGRPLDELSALRSRYIGGESIAGARLVPLPPRATEMVDRITELDRKKGNALRRYYSEMTRVLAESRRVIKPGKAAVFVVGSSTMRGIDTQTHLCLGEIGQTLGLDLVGIGRRALDRDRRMMPARTAPGRRSQIEERMHEEYVIAFVKPAGKEV